MTITNIHPANELCTREKPPGYLLEEVAKAKHTITTREEFEEVENVNHLPSNSDSEWASNQE